MILLIALSILLSVLTFSFSKLNSIGAIRSSAIITLISCGIIMLLRTTWKFDSETYMALSFGASFVGMSCPTRFGIKSIALGGLFFGIFFLNLVPLLTGFGGALGTSAFLAISLVHLIKIILVKVSPKILS